jgi:predicted amidophosphoribosyltransferase
MPMTVTVICPRCRRKTKVPPGMGSCTSCGLRIQLNIEEPRCPQCGYLVYKLVSDVCPECGTPIQQDAAE